MKYRFSAFFILFSFLFFSAQKIYWSEGRKLSWEDFKSKTNILKGAEVVAFTNCGWEYSAKTTTNPKAPVEIKILTVFNSEKSWKDVMRINDYILLHEQKHFDIAEMYARKFRMQVSEKIKTSADHKKLFNNLYKNILAEYKNFQRKYDAETDHGNNKEKQDYYNNFISEELQKLNNYRYIEVS